MGALPELEPDGSERRVAPRMRTLKRAKIIFNGGFSTFDCILRNISATGALLTIDEAAHLPKEFQIRIGEERDERPAKLVYRRGMFAGIRFLDIAAEEDEERSPLVRHDAGDSVERGIRRVEPENLPYALIRLMPWTRR
ncbi:PilZ domain-containing protein [Aurantimonas sp. HBX-1]|uniref:PilZ domain-containing protein n=1 Tax=Aurantimonas sp. HBX-1 TaxID=2906072 RepID=UPI001F1750C2|nr:PilZ domain-containing protein [Aurantimonas sp. HBX-1]UIJ70498.1 PilZ domain-containing protein [Aurantimonas sp. HBX-1]